MKFDFPKALFLVFALISLGIVVRISYIDRTYITIVDNILFLMFMLILCLVTIFISKILLKKLLAWVDGTTEDGADSSLYPIMSVFLNLMIILTFMYVAMNHFGFDLMVTITSLGIVGLAISFGAQSTLQQFFSGMGMMLTRSIKTGDVIRLEGSDTRLIVKSVGAMTSTFESMENSEVIIMPNSAISGSTLCNMTADAEYYCINLIMHFDIADNDLEKLYECLKNSAYGVEHIVTDGTLPKPDVQFMSFEMGNVKTKLLAYLDDVHYYDEVVSNLIRRIHLALKNSGMFPDGSSRIVIKEERHEH